MESPPVKSRSSRLWAIASIPITAMVLATIIVLFAIRECSPTRTVATLADAFKPHVDYQTRITGAISSLKSNPKLVVLTASIDADVKKSASTTALWIYWGTTTVEVRARENKVQFYIPLDDVGSHSFRYDAVHKTLTLITRAPVLDEQFVDVQTDPAKIEEATSNGWAKLDAWSGSPMRDDARHELRNAVLQAAKQPAQYELLMLKAKANAQTHLKQVLEPFTETLSPETKFEIEFLP